MPPKGPRDLGSIHVTGTSASSASPGISRAKARAQPVARQATRTTPRGSGASTRASSASGAVAGAPAGAAARAPRRSSEPRGSGASAVVAARRANGAAAVLQLWWRRVLRRREVVRERERLAQLREEEEEHCAAAARRDAQAAVKREAAGKAAREEEQRREAQLRANRARGCAVEQMCQGLPTHLMPWEEDPAQLLGLLSQPAAAPFEEWIGRHETKKPARKQYLQLARRWHPDKWAMQGDACVAVATEVTKALILAYDKAMRELPADRAIVSCEDEDEDREVFEFASWVGIAFEGMEELWKQRKRVTNSGRRAG